MTEPSEQFVHLHVHSEYSLLDGAARITAPKFNPDLPTIFTEAARLGMPAVAVTDHGSMFGALEFLEAGRAAGVKPILGVEAYVAPGSRFDRSSSQSEEKYYHLTLLAESLTGYRNLLRLVSSAHLEGFYHRPRMDKELMAEYAEGVLCLSGCLSSETSVALLQGQQERARMVAAEYRDIFGPDNFFIELQDHGLPQQRQILRQQIELGKDLGVPIVATNDLHYTVAEDAKPHDVLLCIQQSKLQSDPNRLKFDSEGFYLKDAREMRALFAEVPEACDETLRIAERVDVDLHYGERAPQGERYHLPVFATPRGVTPEAHLRELVERGLQERYGQITPDVRERAEHELGIIDPMGFAGYFLIVWDLIRHAREQGIRVGPGRGSAAGSIVAYSLRITDLDPLRYGLLFERFLNPERIAMPDIDMDFDERRRDEVIRYATDTYGEDHVAQIVTFQTIKGKQGIRDAARVLGFPPIVGDRLCKMYPPAVMGRDDPIERALEISPELAQAYAKEPEAREVIDTARALEGLRREDSVHAAGVVIGDAPLVNYLPLKLAKDSRDASKRVVTQFDMHGVEKLGLLKMDFLGLRTLSVIEETLRHLRRRGVEVDIDHVALDDEATYQMLRRADTTGVFQMESSGVRQLIKLLEPDRFEDLMACVALYRPGLLSMGQHTEYAERKHGRKKVVYPHPDLEPVLRDTYGIIVYQEQVMQTAVTIAGYSMGEADSLRKVMGKKEPELLPPHRQRFVDGAVSKGYEAPMAEHLFDMIVPFADYGFNASHACAYGLVSYQTAYLMAHYPVEYMAAVLTSVKDHKDRKPFYLFACREMNIDVLPPDVNGSELDFAPAGEDASSIRYGLSAVRNVGEGVVEQVIEARRTKGSFTSLTDFCRKVEPTALTKRVLESLIQAGAFDSLGYPRKALLEGHGRVSGPIIAERKVEAAGQFSLFGGESGAGVGTDVEEIDGALRAGEEFEKRELLRCEKEMLGQFVTDHPLLEVQDQLRSLCTHEMRDLDSLGDGDLVTIGGIIGTLSRKYTKGGKPYAQFRLEGLAGGVQVMVFPNLYEAAPELFDTDRIVLVTGRIDLRGRELQIRASDVREPGFGSFGPPPETARRRLAIDLRPAACTPAVLTKLRTLFDAHKGPSEISVRFVGTQEVTPLDMGPGGVDLSQDLLSDLRTLLGAEAVKIDEAEAA